MITHLHGQLAAKGERFGGGWYLVVDVQGVGYQVLTSARNYIQAPGTDEPVKVFTSLIVREDLMQLVGFLTREERDLFDLLSSASGVGAKVALALLTDLSVSEISAAIMAGDYKRLTAAKGVGPKLAQKIALELREKMTKWRETYIHDLDSDTLKAAGPLPAGQAFDEAETVLLSLGYDLAEIHRGLQELQKTQGENLNTLSAEEVLQGVLKWLATHPV